MAYADLYQRQVALLLRVLPFVAEESAFALKGGTAINLFVRDLPRLSVDIDLTYLPIEERSASLTAIDAAMERIAARLSKSIPDIRVNKSRLPQENVVTKLVARSAGVQIKIEITPVLRGCVYEPELRSVSPAVEETFGFAEMRVVSHADLYAGKIVAALDRQHPRDLFDVRDLLANEGVDDALRSAFLVYVASHPRPIAELLAPRLKNIEQEFARTFDGMTREPVAIEQLLAAREAIITTMIADMPEHHRHFLLGFKRGKPDWDAVGLQHAAPLPAVRWKQTNLDRLSADQRELATATLERVLFPQAN